jgi:hypothetical protein
MTTTNDEKKPLDEYAEAIKGRKREPVPDLDKWLEEQERDLAEAKRNVKPL